MIDDKVLAILQDERQGCDEWMIASSIFPWDGNKDISFIKARHKHGAWIRVVVQSGIRLQEKGLVGSYIISHGLPCYNAPQTRIWFALKPHPQNYRDTPTQ